MARRFLLVAIAAIATALAPVAAEAATPAVTSGAFASPVTLTWTPDALLTQVLYRAPGACAAPPMAGQTAIPMETVGSATDAPGEGTFCYYIQNDALAYGGTAQATVDTLAPDATVGVTPLAGAPNFVAGAVTITGTSADAGTGVASSTLLRGAVGGCAAGTAAAAWETTAGADGAYDICNVVADNAGHVSIATATVVVDNTNPLGSVLTPLRAQS